MSAVAATGETIAKGLQQIGLEYGDTVLFLLQCLRISMVV
jgi:hypothetical protein